MAIDGQANLNIPDLSLFSGLAKRDLAGAIRADVAGKGAVGSMAFDVIGNLAADDIKTGFDAVDDLIQGRTNLTVDAVNNDEGLNIRTFQLIGTALSANASGKLDRNAGGLDFSAKLDDLGRLSQTLSGPLSLSGNVAPTGSGLEGTARLDGPDSSYASLQGTVDRNGSADVDFDAKLNQIERFVPEFPGTVCSNRDGPARQWSLDDRRQGARARGHRHHVGRHL